MARNVFEGNDPEVTPDEALKFGGKAHAILMTPEEGFEYKLVELNDGKTAVVLSEKPRLDTCICARAKACPEHDLNSDEARTLRHQDG